MIESDNYDNISLYSDDEDEVELYSDPLTMEYTTPDEPEEPVVNSAARLMQQPSITFEKHCTNCTHCSPASLTLTCVNAQIPDLKRTLGENALDILANNCVVFELREDLADQLLSPEERLDKKIDKSLVAINASLSKMQHDMVSNKTEIDTALEQLKRQIRLINNQKQDAEENNGIYDDTQHDEAKPGKFFSKFMRSITG